VPLAAGTIAADAYDTPTHVAGQATVVPREQLGEEEYEEEEWQDIESPTYARALSAIAGLLLILAAASFAAAGRILPGSSDTQTADLAVAAGLVVLGAGLLFTRSRWKTTGWLATAGLCIGLLPFLSLRMWRSAELLSLRLSRSRVPRGEEGLFGLWGPLVLILLALVLIGILLTRNAEVAFARPRVFGDPTATAIVFGVAALIGLAAIGVALPTPRDNFTSGKFSDPMLLYFAVPLAVIAAVTQGLLRAVVLAGWTAGAAGVLVTTVYFRLRPKNIPRRHSGRASSAVDLHRGHLGHHHGPCPAQVLI
jgi:hypothetical protein